MRLSPAVLFAAAAVLGNQGCSSIPSLNDNDLLTGQSQVGAAGVGAGYVSSEGTQMVRSSYEDCIRTESWSAQRNLVECSASARPPEKPSLADSTGQLASFSGQAMFGFDSADLTTDGMDALLALTDKLNNQAEITEIEVVGHTDSSGSDAYNQMLSERRAATVGDYLKSYLKTVNVSSSGMGESVPVADNNTSEGRSANRRVEVKIGAMMPAL